MLARLLEEERKVTPMKKLKKLTVVGIAAALMVMACAAAVVMGVDQKVLRYFGIAPEQEALMAPTAVRVDKSHTYDNSWTVDIRQALSDRYSMAVLIDVTAPEGIKLDGAESYLDVQLDRKWGSGNYGCHYLEDDTLAGNQASYLLELVFDSENTDNIIGSTWKLTPELFLCVEQDGTSHEIALDDWACTLSLSEQDPGLLYEVDQPLEINGYNIVLGQVYLSPISSVFHLRNGATRFVEDVDVDDFFSDGWQNEIILHTKTGEVIYMGDFHMGHIGGKPNAFFAHYQFSPEKIIDPAEIVSVTLYGQTFSLDNLSSAA